MSANTEQKMKPWAVMSPHGIEYVGLCTDEVHAWHIALGWPPDEEIAQLKKQGWWASDAAVTINHQPPSPRHADHVPDATKMIETAPPSGERERFESWWRSVQLMTFPKEYDIKRLQDWGSIYKPKALDAWQARAALSAGDAGWQPIETAPKDGSDCWLLVDGDVRRGFWVEIEFEERRDMDGRYIDQTDADAYWMDHDSGDSLEPTMFYPITKPLPPSLVDIDAAMRKDKL